MFSVVGRVVRSATTIGGCQYIPSRNVRIRPRAGGWLSDPLARDERLLKKLEDQLARVKDKIRREEDDEERKAKAAEAFARSSNSTNSEEFMLENHNAYFWNQVLTEQDRRALAQVDIHSLEELHAVHSEAERTMQRSPFPSLEKLDSRLQIAHNIYDSIPAKIGEVTRASQKKGVWW